MRKRIEILSILIIAVMILYSQLGNKNESLEFTKEEESSSYTMTTEEETVTETVMETTSETETQILQETIMNNATKETIKSTEAEILDFVSNLKIAQTVSQMIVVSAQGNKATITMHEKSEKGTWIELLETNGFVGKNGVGKASEFDTKTPAGIYSLTFAFGIKENPGTAFSYTKVDNTYYWVDDIQSQYYNQFVSTNLIQPNWSSAEHLIEYTRAYSYVIPIDYNMNRIKGEGSAIFLHVSTGTPTAGCVSVPESDMIFILRQIKQGCVIVIDNQENIVNY